MCRTTSRSCTASYARQGTPALVGRTSEGVAHKSNMASPTRLSRQDASQFAQSWGLVLKSSDTPNKLSLIPGSQPPAAAWPSCALLHNMPGRSAEGLTWHAWCRKAAPPRAVSSMSNMTPPAAKTVWCCVDAVYAGVGRERGRPTRCFSFYRGQQPFCAKTCLTVSLSAKCS